MVVECDYVAPSYVPTARGPVYCGLEEWWREQIATRAMATTSERHGDKED